jgi:hypothetical protein
VKRWVKSIEENYAASGALNQMNTDELESFNVDGGQKPETPPHEAAPAAPSANKNAI